MQGTRVAPGALPPTRAPLLPRPSPSSSRARRLQTAAPGRTSGQVRKRSVTESFTTEFYSRNGEQRKRLPSQLSQDKL